MCIPFHLCQLSWTSRCLKRNSVRSWAETLKPASRSVTKPVCVYLPLQEPYKSGFNKLADNRAAAEGSPAWPPFRLVSHRPPAATDKKTHTFTEHNRFSHWPASSVLLIQRCTAHAGRTEYKTALQHTILSLKIKKENLIKKTEVLLHFSRLMQYWWFVFKIMIINLIVQRWDTKLIRKIQLVSAASGDV